MLGTDTELKQSALPVTQPSKPRLSGRLGHARRSAAISESVLSSALWGRFEGEGELAQLRKWALSFREQVFDHALRQQMIESAEGSRDLAEAFSTERRLLQRLMPDARETLTRLSARYALGMLTNGAPDLQREKIAASGLESLFKEVVISGVYGIGKPRPEIFLHLTDRLGVAPGEAVMVGNSLERDIAGARNAGIASIWLKVTGSEEHAAVEPDFTISGTYGIARAS